MAAILHQRFSHFADSGVNRKKGRGSVGPDPLYAAGVNPTAGL